MVRTKDRTCVLCGFKAVVFDRRVEEPVCVNRTRCRRRVMTQEVRIQQFLKRLREMPLDIRQRWVAAIREEIWHKPKKRKKKDVDSGATSV